jgi:pimeloyl-ACP methyl ester carboxylesterase
MIPFPRVTAVIAGLLALTTLAGCGSSGSAAVPPALSLPEQAPDPGRRCGFTLPAEKVVLTTADGVKLSGARLGSGPHGVVLLPQLGADICGWAGEADRLVQAGLHVLAIDLRCAGYSACDSATDDDQLDSTHDFASDAAAAVAELARAGATGVVVMGASLGAATAVVAAGRFPDHVSGVVGLSVFKATFNASGSASTSVRTPEDAAAMISVPMLIVGSTDDPGSIDRTAAQALIERGGGKVIIQEGSAHGWNMLHSPEVDTEVITFLKANS